MFILKLIGIFGGIIVSIFFPRAILALIAGCLFGGTWWVVFAPLFIIGGIIDCCCL